MEGDLLRNLRNAVSRDDRQHKHVGNGVRVPGFRLERLLERRLGLLQAAEVHLGDGLRDERAHGRGGGGLSQLLEDVEGLLVLFAALSCLWLGACSVQGAERVAKAKGMGLDEKGGEGITSLTSLTPTHASARLTSRLSCAHLLAAETSFSARSFLFCAR